MGRKCDVARNFYHMPQKIFNLGMHAGEIAVYAYLMFRESRKNYQCYPSYRTIGDAVGMSRNTVKKYVDALVEKQLIYVEPTKVKTRDGGVRNGNLLYTIRPLEAALEYHLEQQMKAYNQQTLSRQGTSPVLAAVSQGLEDFQMGRVNTRRWADASTFTQDKRGFQPYKARDRPVSGFQRKPGQ